jgi:hypothetical protein
MEFKEGKKHKKNKKNGKAPKHLSDEELAAADLQVGDVKAVPEDQDASLREETRPAPSSW